MTTPPPIWRHEHPRYKVGALPNRHNSCLMIEGDDDNWHTFYPTREETKQLAEDFQSAYEILTKALPPAHNRRDRMTDKNIPESVWIPRGTLDGKGDTYLRADTVTAKLEAAEKEVQEITDYMNEEFGKGNVAIASLTDDLAELKDRAEKLAVVMWALSKTAYKESDRVVADYALAAYRAGRDA